MKEAETVVSGGHTHTHSGHFPSKMETELLVYKQKTDQMAVLIRHYQSELESQKVRRDGVETVSRLLAESRQENMSLKKTQSALQMMVKNLQSRLAVNGIASSAQDEDNEVIMPSTSKQTLINLALENKRLRSLLQKDDSVEGMDSVHKKSEDSDKASDLEETINRLEAEKNSMKQKLLDLEELFKSSNNEKDRQLVSYQKEIQRLKEQIGRTPANPKASNGLSFLRQQLKMFMARCEDFEKELDTVRETESTDRSTSSTAGGTELVSVARKPVARMDSVDGSELKAALEEKQKLQDRVEEVTQMNQRWQEYFEEREKYSQSLEQKVQDLDGRLKEAMHRGTTPEINRRIEQVLEKSQKEIELVEEMRKKSEEEVEQLRQELAFKDNQISQLQKEAIILKRVPQQQSSLEAQSIIEHLKAQIQVCTEDFENERQDRQTALQKLNSVQEQNANLQKLNTHLQTMLCGPQSQTHRPAAQEHGYLDPVSLQPRGGVMYNRSGLAYDSPQSPHNNNAPLDVPDFDSSPLNFPNTDFEHEALGRQPTLTTGPMSMPASTMDLLSRGLHRPRHSVSDPAIGSDGKRQENFLTCPKCNKEFSEEHQKELLAHMDVCWE